MPKKSLDELIKKREEVNARIRQEMAKRRSQTHKADTRRKVLAGAAVLDRAERDATFKAELDALLARFLVRPDDRALFQLAPAASEKAA